MKILENEKNFSVLDINIDAKRIETMSKQQLNNRCTLAALNGARYLAYGFYAFAQFAGLANNANAEAATD